MSNNPQATEEKIERMINGWETMAPAKTFGGMTLQQFQAALKPSLDTRRQLVSLEEQRMQVTAERDTADEISLEKIQQVVAGVLADPTEGPDSPLYQAFGYTRKSERKSGLTRKSSKKLPPK